MPRDDGIYGSRDNMSDAREADMYSLLTTQEEESDDRSSVSDETTGLLGAGARDSHNSSPPSPGSDAGVSSLTDGWDGYKEFEHLPWYHRPSVWLELKPSNTRARELHSADSAEFRSIGLSRHMHSTLWHSVAQ